MAQGRSQDLDDSVRSHIITLLQKCERLVDTRTDIIRASMRMKNEHANLRHQTRFLLESSGQFVRDLKARGLDRRPNNLFEIMNGDIARLLKVMGARDTDDDKYQELISFRDQLDNEVLSSIRIVARLSGCELVPAELSLHESGGIEAGDEPEKKFHPLLDRYYSEAQNYHAAIENLQELYADREDERNQRRVKEEQGITPDIVDEVFEAGFEENIQGTARSIGALRICKNDAFEACVRAGVQVPTNNSSSSDESESDAVSEAGSDQTKIRRSSPESAGSVKANKPLGFDSLRVSTARSVSEADHGVDVERWIQNLKLSDEGMLQTCSAAGNPHMGKQDVSEDSEGAEQSKSAMSIPVSSARFAQALIREHANGKTFQGVEAIKSTVSVSEPMKRAALS